MARQVASDDCGNQLIIFRPLNVKAVVIRFTQGRGKDPSWEEKDTGRPSLRTDAAIATASNSRARQSSEYDNGHSL